MLLVFLPPLLFGAAFETPLRDLRTNLWPIARLSVGLVLLTTLIVAAVAQALVPGLGWAAAFTLGAIVAPTDALAATSVFRRLGVPRIALTLIEGEALFNDASALILYRAALIATLFGTFVLTDAIGNFVIASIGGVIVGFVVGRVIGGDRPLARRSAGRGPRLAADPLPRVPPGAEARGLGRPGGRHGRAGHRAPARDDALAQQPDPVADVVEDGRVRPQRPRVRAAGPRAARHPPRAELGLPARVPGDRRRRLRRRDRDAVPVGVRVELPAQLAAPPDRRGRSARSPGGSRSWSAGRGSAARCRWPRPWRCRWTSRRAT